YLKGRGITGAIAKAFDIGFEPKGWQNLQDAVGTDERTLQALNQAGLIIPGKQGGYYDRSRHRIMLPIFDIKGRVIAFVGRVLAKEDNPKYLNSPETPLFHKSFCLYGLYQALKLKEFHRAIVVEGYMDVIALSQHGIEGAVAPLGTATSSQHLQELFKYTDTII